jgi:hypothetical protein
MQVSAPGLTPRHRQQTTQLVDLTGKAERLSLQHARRVALVPLFYQFSEAIVERGQLGKQSIKLVLNRRPPRLLAGVQNDVGRFLFLCTHGQIGSKSHAVLQQKSHPARLSRITHCNRPSRPPDFFGSHAAHPIRAPKTKTAGLTVGRSGSYRSGLRTRGSGVRIPWARLRYRRNRFPFSTGGDSMPTWT